MKRFCLILVTFLMVSNYLVSQELKRWEIPMRTGDLALKHALAGGLNSPQFSPIHLNGDSLPDLFVFDRGGHKVLTFIRDGDGIHDYIHAPIYQSRFPKMREWALIRDYNRDSIPDIFTYADHIDGIEVYQGNIDTTGLRFDKIAIQNPLKVLGYPTSTGVIANIYVSKIDIPDISDIDGDGDLDILSFPSNATKIYYYRNLSMENDFGLDSLSFVLDDKCWGKVVESFNTNEVILSEDSTMCPSAATNARQHSGSTIASFDPNLDGKPDILLGDFSYETLLYLENGGSTEMAYIVKQEQSYPAGGTSVKIPFFPAAYFGDFDGDGDHDFIAAPNEEDSRENINVAWYYEAKPDGNGLSYHFTKSAFLVDEMLDFGVDAAPLFIDVNADQLQDLVVASRFHENFNTEHPSQLFYFQNTGTLSSPAFELMDSNWLNLPGTIEESDMLYPTCGDLDGDGDDDLLIGNKRGKLTYIENVGIADGPFEAGAIFYPWFDIDVGFSAAPAIADVDGDGLMDLLIGEERGNINLYRNIGFSSTPAFNSDASASDNDEQFGDIDARQNLAVFGLASPSVFYANDSAFLLVGTAPSNFLLYYLDGDYSNGTQLLPMEHNITSLSEGGRSKLTIRDLDENGYFDVFVGNSRGGISLFRTNIRSDAIVSNPVHLQDPFDMILFPTPTSKELNIQIQHGGTRTITLMTVDGITLAKWQGFQTTKTFDVQTFAPGVYFVEVEMGAKRSLKPWIKTQ